MVLSLQSAPKMLNGEPVRNVQVINVSPNELI